MNIYSKSAIRLVLGFSVLITLSAHAESPTDEVVLARDTVLGDAFQTKLKNILSTEDYTNFNTNLVDFSAPYKLKNGSIYYEAKKDTNSGSAVVSSPDGFYYIAYKKPESNQIIYITNDSKCTAEPHDAIKVFSHNYGDNPVIQVSKSISGNTTNHACNSVYGNDNVKKNTLTRSITTYSAESTAQQQTRLSAESIWGASITNNWSMNNDVAIVTGQAVNAIRTCSANFSLVPKPAAYGSVPGLLYFAQYGYQVVKYNTAVSKNSSYKACIVTAARNFRSAAEMASLGI